MKLLEKVQALLSAESLDYDSGLRLLAKIPHNASTLKYLTLGQDETREQILRYELEEWAKAEGEPEQPAGPPELKTDTATEPELTLPPDLAAQNILADGKVADTPDGVYIIRGGRLDTFKCTVEQGSIKGFETLHELADIFDNQPPGQAGKSRKEPERAGKSRKEPAEGEKKSVMEGVTFTPEDLSVQGAAAAAAARAADAQPQPTLEGLKAQATEIYLERCKLSNRLITEADEHLPALVEQILGLVDRHAALWRQIDALQSGKPLPAPAPAQVEQPPKGFDEMSEAELMHERGLVSSYLNKLTKGKIRARATDAERAQLVAMKESELKAISFYLDLIRNKQRTQQHGA